MSGTHNLLHASPLLNQLSQAVGLHYGHKLNALKMKLGNRFVFSGLENVFKDRVFQQDQIFVSKIAFRTRGPIVESPETLRAIFGCEISLCISKTERI